MDNGQLQIINPWEGQSLTDNLEQEGDGSTESEPETDDDAITDPLENTI